MARRPNKTQRKRRGPRKGMPKTKEEGVVQERVPRNILLNPLRLPPMERIKED